MTHQETVERLHHLFGVGSVKQYRRPGNRRPFWSWRVGRREDVEQVLRTIRPYMVTKAHEADLALEYLALPRPPLGTRPGGEFGMGTLPADPGLVAQRERLYHLLREAKGYGYVVPSSP